MIHLPPEAYPAALRRMQTVPINTNFAEAVLRGHIGGKVYGDDPERPAVFLVAHPCGMSLLFGDGGAPGFDTQLADYLRNASGVRTQMELLQVYPPELELRIRRLAAERYVNAREIAEGADPAHVKTALAKNVVEWLRLNFAFEAERFRRRPARPLPNGLAVRPVGAECWSFPGTTIPRYFWEGADAFAARSIAYGVWHDGQLVSLAFAAFVFPDRLEIGIETRPEFRGRGLATHACAALIEHSLRTNREPVWSCREGNLGSERTAGALGFVQTRRIPYYKLAE